MNYLMASVDDVADVVEGATVGDVVCVHDGEEVGLYTVGVDVGEPGPVLIFKAGSDVVDKWDDGG